MVRCISVLNVGDGACSVVRERRGEDSSSDRTAVIDCGSRSPGARSAADSLWRNLSTSDWRTLSGLVVTHFDADHWEGLLRIAPWVTHSVPSQIRVFFPAVPFYVADRLPGSLMAFITAAGPFGVQAMELSTAWSGLTLFTLCPLASGDSFWLAGRIHEVVWPPRHLDQRNTQRLNRLVQQIEAEADRLASEGHPQLRRSLLETYRNGPFNRHPYDHAMTSPDSEGQRLEGIMRPEKWLGLPPDASVPAIPPEWARRPDFKRLVRRARAAQNDLSLVFHDPEHASLVVFGDAPYRIVKQVSGELNTQGYQVALAPHHGSQMVPGSTPTAETCISQNGSGLGPHWRHHRDSHFNNDNCVRTYQTDIVRSLQ